MGFMDEPKLTLYDGLMKTYIEETTVAKEDGKGLSSNDYTTTEKNKLAGIAAGANKTTVDSAMSSTSTNPVQNKVVNTALSAKAPLASPTLTGTPKAPTAAKGTNTTQIATTAYVQTEVADLKKSVSDGKTLVATAITDKGVETAADATFAVMADNISQIETGGGELHGATISVTTTEETLIGKTITLSLNSTTVATRTFDDNGACSFTDIQGAGTYIMYSSDGTDSAELSVEITAENIINKTVISCEFYLTPDGETITPVDDVAILLKCAEIKDKSYTTMDELLADEQAMGDITMSENAMKYLARSTGFADAVCANETFMTLLGASSYVDATVLNSDLWYQKCLDSPYWKYVFKNYYYLHAGALETITMDGSELVTTNSDGNVFCQIPSGTHTFVGSISGQSFTRTITTDTTDVYVMNEHALYWYGNFMTNFVATANHVSGGTDKNEGYLQAPTINNTTNQIHLTQPNLDSSRSSIGQYITTEKITLDNFSKIYVQVDYAQISSSLAAYQSITIYISDSNSNGFSIKKMGDIVSLTGNTGTKEVSNKIAYLDIPASSGNCYCGFLIRSQAILKVSKIWLG